jgi:hypothetical protein
MKASKKRFWALVVIAGFGCGLWAFHQDLSAQLFQPRQAARETGLSFQRISQRQLSGNLSRTAVPGGWLIVLESRAVSGETVGSSMAFIPDAKHEWDGKTVPVQDGSGSSK